MALKIYISGAITGTTDYKRRFKAAERKITAAGFEAVNPLNLDFILDPATTTWEQYMRADLGLLSACDAIYMIPGWESSKGARIEYEYAMLHGKKIFES